MKLAIVGTSHNMTENEERDVRQLCANICKSYGDDVVVISGGANGVDKIAVEVAMGLGLAVQEYLPKENSETFFMDRNRKIAKDCDELICISIPVHEKKCYHHKSLQNHEKTAGCYTMKWVLRLGKPARFYKVGERG